MSSKKPKKKKKKPHKPTSLRRGLTHTSYTITYEPVEEDSFKSLPDEVKNEIKVVYDLIKKNPTEGLIKCKEMLAEYPNIPIFYNYLSVATMKLKNVKEAENIVKETYDRFPNYLFARINYAQICLEKGYIEEIPRIFNKKYDLQLLYPARKEFHISEFVGFAGIMALYFAEIGEIDTAHIYFDMLRKLGPGHPVTKRVKKVLYPSALTRLVRKLENMNDDDRENSDREK